MGMTANPSSSPRHMSDSVGSPTAQSRRATRSPWNRIVRGGESGPSSPQSGTAIEQIASPSASGLDCPAPSSSASASNLPPPKEEKSEKAGEAHGNAGKKPAWNRPSNGANEVGPVMGAASWPALSESTKAPSNKSSSDSLKSLSDGPSSSPVPISQGPGAGSVSMQKHGSNANSNSMPSYIRQKSFPKRSGASTSADGSLTHPSPQGSATEMPLNSPSSRGHNQRNGFFPQSHGGNDNQQQRNLYRNHNGNHHQTHGGRRNQEHGNHHWNHRNANGRDGHMQPHRVTGFIRHQSPPISPQFIPTQPMQPFGNPVPYPVASPIYYGPPALGAVPFIAPVTAPVFYQVPDPLYTKLVNQVDFYFSDQNLIRDLYLRQNMDEQGYVHVQLIAGFKKVSELTDNIQYILEALKSSNVVEVQGDKIRKRNDWKKWLIPPTVQLPTVSSPRSRERSDQNVLTNQVQNLSLEHHAAVRSGSSLQRDVQPHASTSRSSSGDFSNAGQQLLREDAPANRVTELAASTPSPPNSN